jgi:DMSO/TMAO reductase YedYZ heme-binding membrane subunit
MKDLKNKAETLTDHVTDYMETFFALNVLKATDKAAGIASSSIAGVLIAVFLLFTMLLLSIGLGYLIGQQLDNLFAGFGIVAGFYAVLAVLIIILNKKVFSPFLKNIIIRSAYE